MPLGYRVAYLFMHREGMRKGEVRRLTWGDVDLERGLVSLDENKTDRPRSWVLDPGVAAVLALWKAHHGGAEGLRRRLPAVQWEKLAPIYRGHCEAVGIDRGRLFERKANKLRLRAHDMRAFFITAGMYAGRDALWISDRSGHTTLGMLRTYERDVRRWREESSGEAARSDAAGAIPELAAAFTAAERGCNSDSEEARRRCKFPHPQHESRSGGMADRSGLKIRRPKGPRGSSPSLRYGKSDVIPVTWDGRNAHPPRTIRANDVARARAAQGPQRAR